MKRILLFGALLIPTIGLAMENKIENKITINADMLRQRLKEQGFSGVCDTEYIITALGNGNCNLEAAVLNIMRYIKPLKSTKQQQIIPETSNDTEFKECLKTIEGFQKDTSHVQRNNELSVADLIRCIFPDAKFLEDVLIAPTMILYAAKKLSDIGKQQSSNK